jgi:6-pyruvoyltetrahydropterin/6-carboxytetrahydropterin synthase
VTAITRLYRFSASHRLHVMALSDQENTELYGKCNNPFGHGHDYILEVTVSGPVDPVSGLIVPLAKLDRLVGEKIIRLFASRNINLDIPQFSSIVPTTENIANVIVALIQANWRAYIDDPAVELLRVHVQETDRNGFEIRTRVLPSKSKNSFQTEGVPVHA